MVNNPARGKFSHSERSNSDRQARVRSGIDATLEAEADAILSRYRSGVSRYKDQQDFWTENQWKTRLRREVYTNNGSPDKHIVSGIFKRSYAPPRRKAPRDNDAKGGLDGS